MYEVVCGFYLRRVVQGRIRVNRFGFPSVWLEEPSLLKRGGRVREKGEQRKEGLTLRNKTFWRLHFFPYAISPPDEPLACRAKRCMHKVKRCSSDGEGVQGVELHHSYASVVP